MDNPDRLQALLDEARRDHDQAVASSAGSPGDLPEAQCRRLWMQ